MPIRRLLFLCALLMGASSLRAAAQASPESRAAREPVNVFLDCQWECDSEFIRTEITYVNWVRDRVPADVHLLVTTQSTGGAGQEFTLTFIGQRRFGGLADTLQFVAPATNSSDDTRRSLVRVLALGLARYVARTDAGTRLTVSVPPQTQAQAAKAAAPANDPWNFWTFSLNANTNINGERAYESRDYWMSANANRVTKEWKIRISANQSQNMNRFVVPDEDGSETAFTSFRRDLGFNTLAVRSLTNHLSAGLRTGVSTSTYRNQKLNVIVTPAVEYNVFPYSESTRRELIFQYGIGGRAFRYVDTTIYGRTTEAKPIHTGTLGLSQRERWGNFSLNLRAQQYLDTPKNYNLVTYSDAEIRLYKGLGVNFYVAYERIRDQIYLPAQGATRDEILTRQRQLETGYYYYAFVGLNYTFGSIYNNVVNPRFRFGS